MTTCFWSSCPSLLADTIMAEKGLPMASWTWTRMCFELLRVACLWMRGMSKQGKEQKNPKTP